MTSHSGEFGQLCPFMFLCCILHLGPWDTKAIIGRFFCVNSVTKPMWMSNRKEIIQQPTKEISEKDPPKGWVILFYFILMEKNCLFIAGEEQSHRKRRWWRRGRSIWNRAFSAVLWGRWGANYIVRIILLNFGNFQL